MELPDNTIERLCKIFGYLDHMKDKKIEFVSSKELAEAVGATEYTVRKDISMLNISGYTRKGYDVELFREELGDRLDLNKYRKACIVGLGRLGTALLDYERFQKDGFQIVAGFDTSINKLERIRTGIDVFPDIRLKEVVKQKGIELGIIAVPEEHAQRVADKLVDAGIKGILNFSPVRVNVPEAIVYMDIDFTNALRFIAASFKDKKI